jgi:hypothetical protein
MTFIAAYLMPRGMVTNHRRDLELDLQATENDEQVRFIIEGNRRVGRDLRSLTHHTESQIRIPLNSLSLNILQLLLT